MHGEYQMTICNAHMMISGVRRKHVVQNITVCKPFQPYIIIYLLKMLNKMKSVILQVYLAS